MQQMMLVGWWQAELEMRFVDPLFLVALSPFNVFVNLVELEKCEFALCIDGLSTCVGDGILSLI